MKAEPRAAELRHPLVLLTSVLVVSACGIFYELLISTVSSTLLGGSVLHFSLTIGFFMFFLGVGAYLSKFITTNLLGRFIAIEILLGLLGGLSVIGLYAGFGLTESYYLIAFLTIAVISTLVGLEIPLVTRLMREYQDLKDSIANVLAFDYVGALLASILFPLVLLPYLGVLKTGLCIGLMNILVGVLTLREFRSGVPGAKRYFLFGLCSGLLLLSALGFSSTGSRLFESLFFEDQVIYSEQSAYQKIVFTKSGADLRLYLNGELQFSSVDEVRYHETLVHPVLSAARNRETILVLGGGDGLAIREILKYRDVKRVDLVDIDPAITTLGRSFKPLLALNHDALQDPRVRIINADAWNFVRDSNERYSVILSDLPDPNDPALGKLSSREFYLLLNERLAADGVFVTQGTSPYFSREAYWSIAETVNSVFPEILPVTTYVPSFGQWGFVLGAKGGKLRLPEEITASVSYLSPEVIKTLTIFPMDSSRIDSPVNTIDNQILVHLYESSARRWE